MTPLLFSTFEVTSQAFYRTSLSYAIVNLKPILPGHVLVIPNRRVPRLTDLNDDELACMMRSIKRVGSVIQKVYNAEALTIACQDGIAAGQSVPHVHFHLIPRKSTDIFAERNDEIYPELEKNEGGLASNLHDAHPSSQPSHLKVDADEDRAPRSLEDMVEEANRLKAFFTEDNSS